MPLLFAFLSHALAADPGLSATLVAEVVAVGAPLVADQLAPAQAAAAALAADPAAPADLAADAAAIKAAADLATARKGYEALSRHALQALGEGSPKVWVYHCSMYPGAFAYWIQAAPGVKNPYMGSSMPACGEEVTVKAAVKASSGG